MFELSIACKYLIPRFRQLSVSVISLISVLVIALVVWLIVVFFSVTQGLEKYWIDKLIAVTAPVRVTPTEAYYHSYYYQVDALSDASNYQHKSIGEKRIALAADPYDPDFDQALPFRWPQPDRNDDQQLKDLVKEVFGAIHEIEGVSGGEYENTFGNIRLQISRGAQHRVNGFRGDDDDAAFLAQAAMFGSLEPENLRLGQSIQPLRGADVTNIVAMAGRDRKRLKHIFGRLDIKQVQPEPEGWIIPRSLLPRDGHLQAIAVFSGGRPLHFLVPPETQELSDIHKALIEMGYRAQFAELEFSASGLLARWDEEGSTQQQRSTAPLVIPQGHSFSAQVAEHTIDHAGDFENIRLHIQLVLQGINIAGNVPFDGLEISGFTAVDSFDHTPQQAPPWLYQVSSTTTPSHYQLPYEPEVGDGVLLPKGFQRVGVLAGDHGYISYYSPTPTSVQEQRVPIYVAGFYDPGMIPMGGKLVFVNPTVTSTIRAAYGTQDRDNGEGIRVRFADFSRAEEVKEQIIASLKQRGVDRYWKVETFREYEFAREILQQQKSDKNLFMVIAAVIIVVACSNIISMLIILVKDKRLEIGILRSMGATSRSIALIFGTCGFVMGLAGSLIGSAAALLTLQHLDRLIALIGQIQGHELFNPTFYGSTLPSELSPEALLFVLGVTALFSLLAGVIPAIKASLLKPSAILKAE